MRHGWPMAKDCEWEAAVFWRQVEQRIWIFKAKESSLLYFFPPFTSPPSWEMIEIS